MTYEYFARVWEPDGDSVDRPSGLWRRQGDEELEYLSLVDWTWHPRDAVAPPHPDLLVPISVEQVETLLGDHERFVSYWVQRLSVAKGDLSDEIRVYRQLPNPGGVVDEVFGRDNAWISTRTIRDFQAAGPHDVPDLEPIDTATADRLIQETRGISGATAL
ncbi:hypothetical protein ACFTSF_02070 [Kribbella sp. NPDC056951]|uniref:hypothetical protein n=1 Tax=Kribbella sp. NPDC056951 TaxID=3345978 RepID=UPI00363E072E